MISRILVQIEWGSRNESLNSFVAGPALFLIQGRSFVNHDDNRSIVKISNKNFIVKPEWVLI